MTPRTRFAHVDLRLCPVVWPRIQWAVCLVICGLCRSIAAADGADVVKARINGLELAFDGETGGLLEMRDPRVGTFLKTSSAEAGLIDLAYPIPDFEPLRLTTSFSRGAKFTTDRDGVTITYEKLGSSRDFGPPGRVAARVMFRAAPDGQSVILQCAIENKSQTAVRQVVFPDFKGLLPFAGESGTQFRSGGVRSQPFIDLRPAERGVNFYAQERALAGAEYVPGAYFGTTPMIIQWLDFGGLSGGFSLYRRKWGWEPGEGPFDGTPFRRVIVRLSEIDQTVRLLWANRVECKPGESWTSAEFWLTPHTGGWAKGIEPYRAWAHQNIKRAYPVPDHVRKGLGFRTLWMCQSQPRDAEKDVNFKFNELPRLARESKEHGLDEMVLWGWAPGLQCPVPPPFPHLGTEEELARAIAECKAIGVNVSLFISVYSIAEPSASRYGIKVGAPGSGWTYHTELIPLFNPEYATGNRIGGAVVSDPKWRADVLSSCRQIIDKFTPSIGWDQFAGFPTAPNVYDLTAQIRAIAKAKDPQSTFCGESFNKIEEECNYLDYTWSWGSYDFLKPQPFTSVFPAPRLNPNIDRSPVDVKFCFMDNLYMNVMPRKPGGINGSSSISRYPDLGRALKQCAALRKQFENYFVDGKFIGECLLSEPCPGAHFSSYVLPDRALFIVMNTESDREVSFTSVLDPWLSSRSGEFQIKCYDDQGELRETTRLGSGKWAGKTPRLGRYEFALLEFVPN